VQELCGFRYFPTWSSSNSATSPVSGPLDRVAVDVIQFVKSHQGNHYAVVFVDYLTKWPEVFATKDQTALTIAHLLVEYVISCHGSQQNSS